MQFQSFIHHHENRVKLAQHHWLILDSIITHIVEVAERKKTIALCAI
jgi:hypothetical protein